MSKNLALIGGGEIKGWNFETKDSNQDLYLLIFCRNELIVNEK